MKIAFFDKPVFDTFCEWMFIDKRVAKKIVAMIRDVERAPTSGIGKPEPLRGNLSGHYSRRIIDEHRLVYRIEGDTIIITSCKGHDEES